MRLVRQVGRQMQHFSLSHHHLARAVRADQEPERALEDIRQLLVLVRVPRDDAPLLQVDVSQHDPLAGDEPAREPRRQLLFRQVIPAEQAGGGGRHPPNPTAMVSPASTRPSSNPPGGALNVITRGPPPRPKKKSPNGGPP